MQRVPVLVNLETAEWAVSLFDRAIGRVMLKATLARACIIFDNKYQRDALYPRPVGRGRGNPPTSVGI